MSAALPGGVGAAGKRTALYTSTDAQIEPSESTGMIMVSASPQTLGQITFASQAACRILGYSRQQLERRNVSVIIPSPVAEAQ